MSIVHIYGAAGSGTSTLGKSLNNCYGYKHLDTDDYFWLLTNPPFIKKRPREERIVLLKRDIHNAPKVVISGALCGWGDELIQLFDLVVRLVVPSDVRINRLEQREYQRFGKRICSGGDMYEEHIKFIKWASEYDNGDVTMRSKAEHDEWSKIITCKHIVLDGTLSIPQLIEEINSSLAK